jgi:hypothetical protein
LCVAKLSQKNGVERALKINENNSFSKYLIIGNYHAGILISTENICDDFT